MCLSIRCPKEIAKVLSFSSPFFCREIRKREEKDLPLYNRVIKFGWNWRKRERGEGIERNRNCGKGQKEEEKRTQEKSFEGPSSLIARYTIERGEKGEEGRASFHRLSSLSRLHSIPPSYLFPDQVPGTFLPILCSHLGTFSTRSYRSSS